MTFKEHTSSVTTLLILDENDKYFATGSTDHSIKIWNFD